MATRAKSRNIIKSYLLSHRPIHHLLMCLDSGERSRLLGPSCFNKISCTCGDPGIFVWGGGGGGGPGQSDKKALTFFFIVFFFLFFFLFIYLFFSPQLILQKSNGQFQRNQSISEGVQHFPGGGGSNFFQGGSYCLLSIETHITCDFQGGGSGPPVPPSGSALDAAIFY